jgi:gliding motility-associated-like protein
MKIRLHHIFIVVLLLVGQTGVLGQNKSNRGKEFWLGYSFSSNFFAHAGLSDPVNQQELSLYISTQQAANVTVSINGTTWTQTLAIPANTVDASILVPKIGANDARILSDGLSNRAIHIVSDVPVAVYAHQYDAMYSAATMLMPTETWGFIYYSVNFYQTKGRSDPPYVENSQAVNFPDWYNWFYIVAKDDNTRVLITPSDSCKNGWLPGQTYTVNLSKGEIYTVFGKANFAAGWFSDTVNSSKDLTGSKILSIAGADGNCHPVALFSGTGGMHVCQKEGGEAVQQQVFPAQAWGTRYVTHHTLSSFTGNINETFRNYYRVCVKDPTTVVKRNGVVLTGLVRNFFYQFMDSTGGDFIEADKPILVSQYTPNRAQCWMNINPPQLAIGDPEMFYLSPVEQGQKSVLFYTSSLNLISKSYVNIIVPTAGIPSLLVDGAPVPAAKIKLHPNNPAYSVAIADLSGSMDMPHTITSDSALTATVYGLGAYESYGYNIGCNINNLNIKTEIKNVFSAPGSIDTVTCPNTPFRVYAKIGYRLTNIHWKLSQVPGLFPSTDSIITNPIPIDSPSINGRKYYTYTLQQDLRFASAGTYKIPISYTHPDIDACNNTETDTVVIVVKQGPVANFTFTNPVCLKDTMYFTGASTLNGFTINNYLWNFDDATTQSTVDAKKLFLTSGTQNVRYRIFASNGCVGDTTKAVTINPSPIAKLGITATICQKDSALVTDTSSIGSGTIASRYYSFGDGNTITQPAPFAQFYHHYTNPGTYTVKMVATSNNGCKSDTSYATVTVNPSPVAKFGYDRNICVGDSIRITDTSSIVGGSIISWRYDFGDGNSLVRNNNTPFYHTYTAAGNYTVSLVTVSNLGCPSDTFRRTVTVANKPVATFSFTGRPCIDSNFIFTSSYTNTTNTSWYWSFGDGQTTTINSGPTTTHAYANTASNITVRHAVSIGQGCTSDTAFVVIPNIRPNPTASFTLSKTVICAGDSIGFLSSSTGIASWLWSFGNGIGSNVPPFTRAYPSAGSFPIVLVVKDSAGCGSLPATATLLVGALPQVNAGGDKFIQIGTSVLMDASVSPAGNYTYLWTPATGLNNANVLQPLASPANTTNYMLVVRDPITLCSGSDSVMISVISKLFIPNAFTPNGDGKNDRWGIPGMALYPDGLVTIYNRYGQVVYESKAYQNRPWDGSFKGAAVPNGGYVYIIQLNNDNKEIIKGTVLVIR